ncbi:MAG: hypothetical protein KGI51_17130, partial [Rhodospirillales bacterium]|nr:hypothetical protein [Rhodospirillales bacterium]
MTRPPATLQRIVLHVGPSKTGTTSLQAFLADRARALRALGICYPTSTPPSREGQHDLAWEIRRETGRPCP